MTFSRIDWSCHGRSDFATRPRGPYHVWMRWAEAAGARPTRRRDAGLLQMSSNGREHKWWTGWQRRFRTRTHAPDGRMMMRNEGHDKRGHQFDDRTTPSHGWSPPMTRMVQLVRWVERRRIHNLRPAPCSTPSMTTPNRSRRLLADLVALTLYVLLCDPPWAW